MARSSNKPKMPPGRRHTPAKDPQAQKGANPSQSAGNSERAHTQKVSQQSGTLWTKYRQSRQKSSDTSLSPVEQDTEAQGVRFRAAHDQSGVADPLPIPAAQADEVRGEPSKSPRRPQPPPLVSNTPPVAKGTHHGKPKPSFTTPITPGGGANKGVAASSPMATDAAATATQPRWPATGQHPHTTVGARSSVQEDTVLHGATPRSSAIGSAAQPEQRAGRGSNNPQQQGSQHQYTRLDSGDDPMSSSRALDQSRAEGSPSQVRHTVTTADVHPEPTGSRPTGAYSHNTSGFPDPVTAAAAQAANRQQQQGNPGGGTHGSVHNRSPVQVPLLNIGQQQQPQQSHSQLLRPTAAEIPRRPPGLLGQHDDAAGPLQQGKQQASQPVLDPGNPQHQQHGDAERQQLWYYPPGFLSRGAASGVPPEALQQPHQQQRRPQTGYSAGATAMDAMGAAASQGFPQEAQHTSQHHQATGNNGQHQRQESEVTTSPASQQEQPQSKVRLAPHSAWQDILYTGVHQPMGTPYVAQPQPHEHQHGRVWGQRSQGYPQMANVQPGRHHHAKAPVLHSHESDIWSVSDASNSAGGSEATYSALQQMHPRQPQDHGHQPRHGPGTSNVSNMPVPPLLPSGDPARQRHVQDSADQGNANRARHGDHGAHQVQANRQYGQLPRGRQIHSHTLRGGLSETEQLLELVQGLTISQQEANESILRLTHESRHTANLVARTLQAQQNQTDANNADRSAGAANNAAGGDLRSNAGQPQANRHAPRQHDDQQDQHRQHPRQSEDDRRAASAAHDFGIHTNVNNHVRQHHGSRQQSPDHRRHEGQNPELHGRHDDGREQHHQLHRPAQHRPQHDIPRSRSREALGQREGDDGRAGRPRLYQRTNGGQAGLEANQTALQDYSRGLYSSNAYNTLNTDDGTSDDQDHQYIPRDPGDSASSGTYRTSARGLQDSSTAISANSSMIEDVYYTQIFHNNIEIEKTQFALRAVNPNDTAAMTTLTNALTKLVKRRDTMMQRAQRIKQAKEATSLEVIMPKPDPSKQEWTQRELQNAFAVEFKNTHVALTAIKHHFTKRPAPESSMEQAITMALKDEALVTWFDLCDHYPKFHVALKQLALMYMDKKTAQQAVKELVHHRWDGKQDFKKYMAHWELKMYTSNIPGVHAESPQLREQRRQQAIQSALSPKMAVKLTQEMLHNQIQGKIWNSNDMVKWVVDQSLSDDPETVKVNNLNATSNSTTTPQESITVNSLSAPAYARDVRTRDRRPTVNDIRERSRSRQREQRGRSRDRQLEGRRGMSTSSERHHPQSSHSSRASTRSPSSREDSRRQSSRSYRRSDRSRDRAYDRRSRYHNNSKSGTRDKRYDKKSSYSRSRSNSRNASSYKSGSVPWRNKSRSGSANSDGSYVLKAQSEIHVNSDDQSAKKTPKSSNQ